MNKYVTLDPKDVVISEEDQQKMKEADYAYKGKKTIVYNDNEHFKIYPKNKNLAIGNFSTVYSFIHNKKLNPYQSQCNGISYNINNNNKISAQRLVLETFASNSNSDNLQPLIIGDNKNDIIYDPAHNKVTLAWSHFGQDPKSFNSETEFSKEQQEIIKKSDYTTGKKTIVYDDNEQFRVYPKNNNFVIGNRATIYNLSKGKKAAYNLDKDGYERCYLGKDCGVHRAVMETFNPVDNMENLQVNHIDCNKQNNIYQPEHGKVNLEWSTPKENIAHAIVMNHRLPCGGNHHKAIYKEEDIWKICKLMAKGYTGRQIAEELKIEYTPQFQDLTTKIRKKESWKNISDKFPEIQPRYRWNKNK